MTAVTDWIRALLATVSEPEPAPLSGLPLAGFQARAATRLVHMIDRFGGAMLCDGVGMGKTRVCLAVGRIIAARGRRYGVRRPIVAVVPARTRSAWRRAVSELGLRDEDVRIVTHASMSRGGCDVPTAALVVVDEAHRFRNRRTARRRHFEQTFDGPVLLATATPVVNGVDDLKSLLELFLDDADAIGLCGYDLATVFELVEEGRFDAAQLLRSVIVRRVEPPSGEGFGTRPGTRLEVVSYDPSPAERWMWRNLEPTLSDLHLAAFGGEWPRALFVEHVLRVWESGVDALAATVEELVSYHRRFLEAAAQGSALPRAAYRRIFGDVPQQSVLPFLLTDSRRDAPAQSEVDAVGEDLETLASLHARIERLRQDGTGRDALIAELACAGEKLLVFTSYRRAAHGLFDRLVLRLGSRARVGVACADGARATGLGPMSVDEVALRFSPVAHGASLREHETLQVLIATDCLAEGVNLQDCGRVVLADLPYTPVGIQQRIGRLVRPGGEHETVTVYLPRPRDWNDSLGMRRRLHSKLEAAECVSMGAGDSTELGPLAALVALDEVARRHGRAGRLFETHRAWRSTRGAERWLVHASVSTGGESLPWLFIVEEAGTASAAGNGAVGSPAADTVDDGAVASPAASAADNGAVASPPPIVVQSLEHVVPVIVDLLYDDAEVEPTAVPAVVERTLRERRNFLEAARLAPRALDLDGPECRAWRLLASEVDPGELEEVRARLLRPHLVSERAMLGELVEGDVRRLHRYVKTISAKSEKPVSITLIAALGLPGCHRRKTTG